MLRQLGRNSVLSVVVAFAAMLIVLVAMAAVAQMKGADQRSTRNAVVPVQQDGGAASHAPLRQLLPGAVSTERARAIHGAGAQGPLNFLPAVTYNSGGFDGNSVKVADVNGDHKPDLVVANGNPGLPSNVGVLLGNGDGTFNAPVTYSSGGWQTGSLAIGDVNGDGKPDLVVANYCMSDGQCGNGTVGVLLGNGDGTFQPAVTYNSGGYGAESVAIADVNGDGHPDVIVVNRSGGVGVLLGNGNGSFQPVVTFSSGPEYGYSLAVADVNRDGKLDLIVGSNCSSGSGMCHDLVSVLLGNGDGSFQPAITYDSGELIESSVAVADVNGDGNPDVLVANLDASSVGVLLGRGDGTFLPVATYGSGSYPSYTSAVVAADINGDGKLDLIASNSGGGYGADGSVSLLLGNGDGTFQQAVTYDGGAYYVGALAAADLNGDGKPDVVAGTVSGVVAVLLNNAGAPPTTTSLASNVNPAAFNQIVTYTASVSASGGPLTGTVDFTDGSSLVATVTLTNDQASYSTSYNKISTHTITAIYSGELHVATGSKSDALTEYVRGASKTILTTSGSPTYLGQPVTFTAKVTSKYGTIPNGELVTFYDGTTTLASVALESGTAAYTTSSLSAKVHIIKATYVGDTEFAPSSGSVTQVVDKYPTTTTLTSSPNPSNFGQTVTFTATVTPSGPYAVTGKVKFLDGTTGIGTATLSGGVATLKTSTLAVGTHPITAQYLSDAYNAKSTSPVVNQVVQ